MDCGICRNQDNCIQNNTAETVDKRVHANVIVMVTPVYFYTMNAQMKMLIDRTLPRYTRISRKEFYFIATAVAGKETIARTTDGFRCPYELSVCCPYEGNYGTGA